MIGDNFSSGLPAIRPAILSFDVSNIAKEINDSIVNVLSAHWGIEMQGLSSEVYALEKQLLTLAIRDEISIIKPHTYIRVPYVDTIFKTSNGSGSYELNSSIFDVRVALHKTGLFHYLSGVPDTSIFLDVVYMKPFLYIHIKEM